MTGRPTLAAISYAYRPRGPGARGGRASL